MDGCSIGQWCCATREDPASFKRKLKLASEDPLVGDRAAWAVTKSLQSLGISWQCEICGDHLKSKQALAVHRAMKHGVRHVAHALVEDTFCPTCLTEFWSRHKVLEHLQEKAPRCLAYLILTATPISQDRVKVLDEQATLHAHQTKIAGSRRASAVRPAIRLAGPLPNVPMEEPTLGAGRRWLN